jgi:hypothetical protein
MGLVWTGSPRLPANSQDGSPVRSIPPLKRLQGYEALGYRTDPLLPWRRDERPQDAAR